MGITVSFWDIDTNELLLSNAPCDWKFEVGQVFGMFWGCRSEVRSVDLTMSLVNGHFEVHQLVWVKRTSLFKEK